MFTKGVTARVYFPMVDTADSVSFVTGLAGSMLVQVSKDGGALATATNSPTEIGGTGIYVLVLTATEMAADQLIVRATDAAALDQVIPLATSDIRNLVKLTGNLDVLIDGGAGFAAVRINAGGFTTQARVRGFANAADKIAATLGAADDADSEVSRALYTFTAAATGSIAGLEKFLQDGDGEQEL